MKGGWSARYAVGDAVRASTEHAPRRWSPPIVGIGTIEAIGRNGWIRVRWEDGSLSPARPNEIEKAGKP